MRIFLAALIGFTLLIGQGCFAQKSKKTGKHQAEMPQGIYGKVELLEGNFMPGPDAKGGTKTGVKRTMYLYSPALQQDSMPDIEVEGTFVKMKKRKPTYVVTSKRDGSYRLPAKPGTYSLVVVEEGRLYCNGQDGRGYLCPITIRKGQWELMDVQVNYKAVY